MLAGHPPGAHHHLAVHRVQRLDHPGGGERPLDLLAEAVGVHRVQRGRHAAAVVQRVGHVDEHLPGQGWLAGGHERGHGRPAGGGVDQQLRKGGGLGEAQQAHAGVLGLPLRIGRGAELAGLGAHPFGQLDGDLDVA